MLSDLRNRYPIGGRLWSDAGRQGIAHTPPFRRARASRHSSGRSAPQGMPETRTIRDAYKPRKKASGMTWEHWQAMLASKTHPRRLMTLEEMANVAVFMASDKAGRVAANRLVINEPNQVRGWSANRKRSQQRPSGRIISGLPVNRNGTLNESFCSGRWRIF